MVRLLQPKVVQQHNSNIATSMHVRTFTSRARRVLRVPLPTAGAHRGTLGSALGAGLCNPVGTRALVDGSLYHTVEHHAVLVATAPGGHA